MGSLQRPLVRPELREPLRAALASATGVESANDVAWPPLDAADVRILVEHGVAPLVFSATGLPALRAAAIHAAALETCREYDLREVLDLLAGRSVEPLLLKGSALAYALYPAPELRPRIDTDLLIRRSELPLVREEMRGAGFQEQLTSGDEHGVRQMFFTREGPMGIRHSYDIHWEVTNSAIFAAVLDGDRLRERSIPVERLGPHARTLSPIDALLLACIHRVAHHQDSDRLIWLADIALLRDALSAAEQEEFWKSAAAGRIVAVCGRSIDLACEWFLRNRAPGPREWLTDEEISRHEPSRRLIDPTILYGNVIAANLRALPWRSRLTRLRQLAFPPATYMAQRYGPGSAVRLPLLYLRRGLSAVRRLITRRADL